MAGEDPTIVLIICVATLGFGRVVAMLTSSLVVVYAVMAAVIISLGVVNTAISSACTRLADKDQVTLSFDFYFKRILLFPRLDWFRRSSSRFLQCSYDVQILGRRLIWSHGCGRKHGRTDWSHSWRGPQPSGEFRPAVLRRGVVRRGPRGRAAVLQEHHRGPTSGQTQHYSSRKRATITRFRDQNERLANGTNKGEENPIVCVFELCLEKIVKTTLESICHQEFNE